MMNKMNMIELNMEELTMVAGGTGPLTTEKRTVGWPNGWDFTKTGPLASCDPPFKTGPLTTGPLTTGPLTTGPLTTGPLA